MCLVEVLIKTAMKRSQITTASQGLGNITGCYMCLVVGAIEGEAERSLLKEYLGESAEAQRILVVGAQGGFRK